MTTEERREAWDAWAAYAPPHMKHESSRIRDAFMAGYLAMRAADPSAEKLERAVEALQWCVDHEGECLGDHPAKINAFKLLLAEGKE